MRNRFYVIYKLTAPNEKFYIGQTSEIKVRFSQYRNLKENNQPKLLNSIKKYGWESFKVELLYNGVCSKEEVDLMEEKFIAESWCDNILNISKFANGFQHLSGKLNPNSKCIYQYSIKGKFIKKWDCGADITKTTSLDGGYISNRCLHKEHFSYNYFWFYEDENNIDYVTTFIQKYFTKPPKNSKKVVQLTAHGEFVEEWESATAASKYYNVMPSSISSSTLGLHYLCKGYKWVKKEDYDKGNYVILDCFYFRAPIKVTNKKTKEEYIFKSTKEAGKSLKISPSTLSNILNKKIKNPRNYEVEYYKGK